MLDTVRVTFDNGETMTTDYNAAVGREGIAKYYMGNWFNLGVEGDDMHKVLKVEFDFQVEATMSKERKNKVLKFCESYNSEGTVTVIFRQTDFIININGSYRACFEYREIGA